MRPLKAVLAVEVIGTTEIVRPGKSLQGVIQKLRGPILSYFDYLSIYLSWTFGPRGHRIK